MSRRLQAAVIAVVLTIFVMGFGVARATTSSAGKPVKACRAQGGYLVLATGHHQCPQGAAKVKLGATGPQGPAGATGPTGPTGATGKTGPQGPGAVVVGLSTNTTATGPAVHVGNWTYSTSCAIDGTGAPTVQLTTTGPAGTTFDYFDRSETDHNDTGTTTTNDGRARSISGSFAFTSAAAVNNSFRSFLDIYVLASDGSAQHLSGVIESDGSPTQGDTKCLVEAQVVPAG